MLWRDQPRRRAWTCAWLGLILMVGLRGLPAAADDRRLDPSVLNDPIELTARRVAVWDAPDGRWVVLSGEAAAIQGLEGLRASTILVRITRAELEGVAVHQAEVHAEGEVRSTAERGKARQQGRTTLRTNKEARVRSYEPSGVLKLPSPPKGLAIIDRAAFPALNPAPPAPLAMEVVEQAHAAAPRRDSSLVEAQALVPSDDDQPPAPPLRDPDLQRAQSTPGGFVYEPEIELPPIDDELGLDVPDLRDNSPAPAPRRPAPRMDDEDDLDPDLEPLPDEFHAWATKIADGLREEAAALAAEVEAAYEATLASLPEGWGRKEFAMAVAKHPARSCLFLRLDDKDYRGLLWQRVRPKVTEES